MKNVLLLGASGNIAPHIIPGLEQHYRLRLADIKNHPGGKPTMRVDMGCLLYTSPSPRDS